MSARAIVALIAAGAMAGSIPAGALEKATSDSVKTCPQGGPDALLVPGTSTCIRISGRVTTDVTGGSRRAARDNATGFGASGRVAVDARTDTDYGPVRGYVRLRAGQGTVPRN